METARYQDNLSYSLYNRRYIDSSIQRNGVIRQKELKNRVVRDYSVNKYPNNNMYSGYTNYLNGNPYELIYEDAPLRSFVRNQGENNRNTQLTDSVKSMKTVGGYLVPYEDIHKVTIKANYGQRVKGIV